MKAEGQDQGGGKAPEEATAPHCIEPGAALGARTPRGPGTKTQAPRGNNRTDTHLTHWAERPTRTPETQAQRATPHLAAPPGHLPAT